MTNSNNLDHAVPVQAGNIKKISGQRAVHGAVALVVGILVVTTGACAGAAYLGARFGSKKETRVIAACEGNPSCRVMYKDVHAALTIVTYQDVPHVAPPDEQDPDQVPDHEIIGMAVPSDDGAEGGALADDRITMILTVQS